MKAVFSGRPLRAEAAEFRMTQCPYRRKLRGILPGEKFNRSIRKALHFFYALGENPLPVLRNLFPTINWQFVSGNALMGSGKYAWESCRDTLGCVNLISAGLVPVQEMPGRRTLVVFVMFSVGGTPLDIELVPICRGHNYAFMAEFRARLNTLRRVTSMKLSTIKQ